MTGSNIRNLDIGMLRTFDALMRERSVSRAATRLFLSQPAVSQSLARLRRVFNDPLFTRNPHGVTPTAKANALADPIAGILADVERVLEDAAGGFHPATARRVFRLAGGDYSFHALLPALAHKLHEQTRAIQLHWLTLDFVEVDQQLARGELDLALVPRVAPRHDAFNESLFTDPYVLTLGHRHPLADADTIDLDTFCQLPQAVLGSGTFKLDTLIDDALARASRQRRTWLTVATSLQLVDLVSAGTFAAVMPARLAAWHHEQLVSLPMPIDLPPYTLQMCHHSRSDHDAGLHWLRAEVRQLLLRPHEAVAAPPNG